MKRSLLMTTKIFLALILFSFFLNACKKSSISFEEPSKIEEHSEQIVEEAYPDVEAEEFYDLKWKGSPIKVAKKKDHYVWMGDIAFDQKTFDSLKNANNENSRTFTSDPYHYWYQGVVFYTIDFYFTDAEEARIVDAINHWTANTSVRFEYRSGGQTDYIEFKRGGSGSGFYSDYIGKKGGKQTINIEGNVGVTTGTIIHEIGHAIGFYHEQMRSDRDNTIQILWNNIELGKFHNFETYIQRNEPGAEIGAFDFGSVMLYSSFAFSKNGQPTITRVDGTTFFAQRTSLSAGDIETSNFIYGPPFARISYQQGEVIDESSNTNEWHREEGTYYINFFADAACTIPINLPTDKVINYLVAQSYSQTQGGSYLQTTTLPAGQHSYYLSSYFFEYRTEYGNYTTYTQTGAVGAGNGFFR